MPKQKIEKRPKEKYLRYVFVTLILVVLVITNTAAYFWGGNKKTEFDLLNFPLLDPARVFYDQKDLIVNIQPLRDTLTELGDSDPNVSIYFEFLSTGVNIAVNKDAEFFPASLLKLPLAMSVVKKIERGEWKWGNELVLMGPDKDSRFGDLYKNPIGTRFTIETLIREMLLNSDNTAYLILLRNLEPDEFKNTQEHLGLQDFFSRNGKISAKKYSVILRALYSASYLTPEDSNKLINIMAETKFKEYLGGALPSTVPFSHKIGVSVEEGVHLDAGIVYVPKRPYLLSVMVKTKNKILAEKMMREISQRVYNYVSGYHQVD